MNIMTATQALEVIAGNMILFFDEREQTIKSNMLLPDMEYPESINWLNAYVLWCGDFDKTYSPAIYYTFLNDYCGKDFAEGFLFFYKQLAEKHSLELDLPEVTSGRFSCLLDIPEYAEKAKSLGYKKYCGNAFKEPFYTEWNNIFDHNEYALNSIETQKIQNTETNKNSAPKRKPGIITQIFNILFR